MHPAGFALRVGGVLRVAPDAAPSGQKSLGVGGDSGHRHTLDIEIRCPAQQVLARLAAADDSVVLSSAVAAGDMYRFAEVLPDALQQHHQLVVDEDDVAALAGELPDAEAGRKLAGGVTGETVFFDSDKDHDLSLCAYYAHDVLTFYLNNAIVIIENQ